MTRFGPIDARLAGVAVPRSLVAMPARFGGTVEGDCLVGDLILKAGRAAHLESPSAPVSRIVVPRWADPHLHLDKCHTAHRLQPGGDLSRAIELQSADKANWTEDDIRARALRGLEELRASGCGAVRTHCDWPGAEGSAPLAWEVPSLP